MALRTPAKSAVNIGPALTIPTESELNIQEREELNRFLQQLVEARLSAKDSDAERSIEEACARQPNAPYLLVQRCLLLDQALQSAQAEIARLEAQKSHREPSASFLDGAAWGNSAAPRASPASPAFTPSAAPPTNPTPAPTSAWGAGLLGTVASTAAGVVAGSFLFQGIEHLMGSHGTQAGPLSDTGSQTTKTAPESGLLGDSSAASGSIDGLSALDVDSFDPDWV